MTRFAPLTIAAAFIVAVVASPALAQQGAVRSVYSHDAAERLRSVSVDFSGLDLNSPQGARAAMVRIAAAADRVCDAANVSGPSEEQDFRACRQMVLRTALGGLRAPTLPQLAAQDTGAQYAAR